MSLYIVWYGFEKRNEREVQSPNLVTDDFKMTRVNKYLQASLYWDGEGLQG